MSFDNFKIDIFGNCSKQIECKGAQWYAKRFFVVSLIKTLARKSWLYLDMNENVLAGT